MLGQLDRPSWERWMNGTQPQCSSSAGHQAFGSVATARRLASLRVAYWRTILSPGAPLPEVLSILRGRVLTDEVHALVHAIERAGRVADGAIEALARALPAADPEGRIAEAIAAGAVAGDPEWTRRVDEALREYRRLRERFVRAHLALVLHFARRWARRSLPFADLVQEGAIGLIHAADRFDPDRGVQFSTYAVWWLRQGIRRAYTEHEPVVRVPRRMRRIAARSEAELPRLRGKLGRDPDDRELAGALGVTPERLRCSLNARNIRVVALGSPLAPGASITALDVLTDEQIGEDTARHLERHDVAEAIVELGRLDARERRILRDRFGLDGDAPRTRGSIATELSLSGERVRQIQKLALDKLRVALDRTG